MPLYHNDDQAMLKDSAVDFMKNEAPVSHLREFRDKNCKDGFSHALWKQFAEMGFTGMLAAEEDGGLGMGNIEAGIVLEEIGRNLTPSPFLTTSVIGVTGLNSASKDMRDQWESLSHGHWRNLKHGFYVINDDDLIVFNIKRIVS